MPYIIRYSVLLCAPDVRVNRLSCEQVRTHSAAAGKRHYNERGWCMHLTYRRYSVRGNITVYRTATGTQF